jgi:hypothetical protein
MARNLRAKIPASDTLYICDTNPAATEKFAAEGKDSKIQVMPGPRQVAEHAVG